MFRRSLPEVFQQKVALKICSKFTGEHPWQGVILIKLLYTSEGLFLYVVPYSVLDDFMIDSPGIPEVRKTATRKVTTILDFCNPSSFRKEADFRNP